jgi:hypothetical protein
MVGSVLSRDKHNVSVFSLNYNIPNFKSDPWGWETTWEKLLQTLSPVDDVYPIAKQILGLDCWTPSLFAETSQESFIAVRERQEMVVYVWGQLKKQGHFQEAWLLLDEKERMRHILNGLEGMCESSLFAYNSRAFCPEITVRSMLKRRGVAFIDFLTNYCKGKTDEGTGNVYLLQNEWWQQILNVSDDPNIETTFSFLTLERNISISKCAHIYQIFFPS